MLAARFLSFLVLWTIILVLVFSKFIGGIFFVIACIGLFAQWEFYRMQEGKNIKVFKKTGVTCGALLFIFSYLQLGLNVETQHIRSGLEVLIVLVVILGTLARQVFEKEQSQAVATIGLTLLGFFYVPYLSNFFLKTLFLRGADQGFYLIVYLIAVTKLTDVGAYTIGSLIGRHKMIPRISPKKTWEGFFGGLLIAVAASVILVRVMPQQLDAITPAASWILGIVLGLLSVVGDLAASVVKRDSQSKDSGVLIPGIGGALDLIDSLLFTSPIFYCYLTIFAAV
ncbi:MAG: phosphatidate cytidylyltransferase [bacterium]